MAASQAAESEFAMSESSVNSAINTATTIVGTPLQWLDVLVTSVLSGAVALAVGLLAIIVLSLLAWWRPISIAPFMRWVVAAAVGAAVAALYVADSRAKFGAATWPYWLCAVVIVIAVLLLLAMGMIAAGVRGLWRMGKRAADAGGSSATAAPPRTPPDAGAT